jgi:hypothetical protein
VPVLAGSVTINGSVAVLPPVAVPPPPPPAPPPPATRPAPAPSTAPPPTDALVPPGIVRPPPTIPSVVYIPAPPAVPTPTTGGGTGGGTGGTGGTGGDGTGDDAPLTLNTDELPSLDELLDPIQFFAYSVLTGQDFVDALIATCDLYGVDAKAAAAVAFYEGIFGGIGDSGTSYGPWQLHAGGALPASYSSLPRFSTTAQAWAWSQDGMTYAIRNMGANGARGKRGHDAVHAIVYRFERPADKAGETSRANGKYDTLAGEGASWQATVAGWALGPSLTSGTTGGVTQPVPYIPAGVLGNWRTFVDVFKLKVPAASASIRSNANALIRIVQ